MNALEQYRQANCLTFAAIAAAVGLTKPTVWRHCAGSPISGESACLYHAKLGLPLEALRPDLWPPAQQTPSDPPEAA